jgi:hypothetical protein
LFHKSEKKGGMVIKLDDRWIVKLLSQPETGMGYHIVSVILNDGITIKQVLINEGYITRVKGFKDIPFKENDIYDIYVTHEKWDFKEE